MNKIPEAFEAFEEIAAYAQGKLTRAQALTVARDVHPALRDEYRRSDLRVIRVYMIEIFGQEAEDLFAGEYEIGWKEVQPISDAQKAKLIPMWKIEPKSAKETT